MNQRREHLLDSLLCRTKPARPPRSGAGGCFSPCRSPCSHVWAQPHQPHHGWSWRKTWKAVHPQDTQPPAVWWSVLSMTPVGCREGRPGSCSVKINSESVVLDEVGLFSHSNNVLQVSGSDVSRKQARYSVFSSHQQPEEWKRSGAATQGGSALV